MKMNRTDKKRKLLRRLYGTLSLSSALFVFQACYGSPHDMGMDVGLTGTVTSKTTNLPIPGIKVSIVDHPQYEITDNQGRFTIYTSHDTDLKVRFEDIDASTNGTFAPKDTIVKIIERSTFLEVKLDGK